VKLTKQTLKRIIKEELSIVLRESFQLPQPPTINIPSKYKSKIDSLIDSFEPDYVEQATEIIKTLGGDPSYVEERQEYSVFEKIGEIGARHREELRRAEAELPKDALRGGPLDKSTEAALDRYSDMRRKFAIQRSRMLYPLLGDPEKTRIANELYDGVRSFDQQRGII
jgi:hypothetical protein